MLKGIVTLIVLALLIQNTCIYGYAGKTAVSSPHMHKCPFNKHQQSKSEGKNRFDQGSRNLNHAYVFTSSGTGPELEFFGPSLSVASAETYMHDENFRMPPLRPPRYTFSSYA